MPSREEISSAAKVLNGLTPGFLPEDLFYAISRLTVLTAAELVPVRKTNDKIEVLLTPRYDDDPFFAGKVHLPGQIYRPGDSLYSRPLSVIKDELPQTQTVGLPRLISSSYIYDYGRGSVIERIYYIFVSDSLDGQFYDVDNLPDNIINGHGAIIEKVVNYIVKEGAI